MLALTRLALACALALGLTAGLEPTAAVGKPVGLLPLISPEDDALFKAGFNRFGIIG